jgi:hypothetical protein
MHVRGSSLSHPKVIEALRPFIVAFWGQANDEPIPDDVRPLYEASGFRGGSNVRCFVLDSAGRLVHHFNGFPGNAGNPVGYPPEQYAGYFAGEIARGAAGLSLPKAEAARAAPELPDVGSGVRLFIRLPGRRDSYGSPVVEVVQNRDEWTTLAYQESAREIDAGTLSRWLRLCYPPGVNEQLEPFKSVKGTLTLRPAGEKQAVLSGKVRMALKEGGDDLFQGTFEAVLTYAAGSVTLRGVVDGVYWRFDPRRNGWMEWRLTTAVESRPN